MKAAAAGRTLARAWPLSAFGSLNLAAALALWALSRALDVRAGLFLAVLLLLLLAAAVLAVRLAAGAARADAFAWSPPARPRVGSGAGAVRLESGQSFPGWPLRVQLELAGRLTSSGRNAFRAGFRLRFPAAGSLAAALPLPASGRLELAGGLVVRDLLGLARARFGPAVAWTAAVLPAPCRPDLDLKPDEAASRSPDAVKRPADTEKIFMREYAPGDLARDINWKALARTGQLVTRIPPEAPRDEKFLHLLVLAPPERAGLVGTGLALAGLEHLRSLAAGFLATARERLPDYGFQIRLPGAEFRIGCGEGWDPVLEALARMGLAAGTLRGGAAPAAGTAAAEPDDPADLAAPADGAWIVAAADDPRLLAGLPEYAARRCRLLLSSPGGRRPEWRLAASSGLPACRPSLALAAATLADAARAAAGREPAPRRRPPVGHAAAVSTWGLRP